ncbi:33693_t:CDS:2, partial [Gigaspora margarita]
MPNINVEQLITEYPMEFTIDEINIALKEAKLVNTLYEAITSDEPEKHPLFEISSQLTPAGYEHMFNCYNKEVVRITKI